MRRASSVLAALAALAAVCVIWFLRASIHPHRIHVVVAASSDPGGLDRHQREGLRVLITDQLEVLGPWTLLEGLPPEARLPKGALRLRIRATFWDGHLRLEPTWEGAGAPAAATPALGTPDWAISNLLAPLGVKAPKPGLLRPEDPAGCMELIDLLGRPILDDPEPITERLRRISKRFPDCATLQYLHAGAMYNGTMFRPGERSEDPRQCEKIFRRAMALYPNLPRGIRSYAFFATDTGRASDALEASLACAEAHPHSSTAALAVAYPARISSLLDLSERAMEKQARLTGLPRTMHTAADNSRLYRGDISGFAAGLEQPQAGAQSALLDFYRGYARLLAGDRSQALPHFNRGIEGEAVVPGFNSLCRIYSLALQGREAEALVELKALARSREKVQVLDGEFTFKLAEAYGFLHLDKEALEAANHAATQGFLCLRWYEAAPFLDGARKLPYWATLRRHLQERQATMEARFPISRLTP